MTEAPERIWAKRTGEFLGAVEVGAWCDTVRQFDNPSEYILLSTHEAAVAAARKEGMDSDLISEKRIKYEALAARISVGKASQQEACDAIMQLCRDNERLAVIAGRLREEASK